MKRHRRRAGSIGARPSWGPHSLLSCSSPSWVPSSLVSFSSLLRLFFLCLWRRWLSPSSLSCCLLGGGVERGEERPQSLKRHSSATAETQTRPSCSTGRALGSRTRGGRAAMLGHRAAVGRLPAHWGSSGTACSWTRVRLCQLLQAPVAFPCRGSTPAGRAVRWWECCQGHRVVLCLFFYNKQLYIVSVSIPLLREL